jgi:hypothetical protein
MILEDMDFTDFYKQVRDIFSKHFSAEETKELMSYVEILADANFRCYKANMLVIAERKKGSVDNKLIADMEWVARSVGEYRVASKANINKYIATVKSVKEPTESESWVSDDIVYSVGEMMDRLSIETIKREDFRVNSRPQYMTDACQALSDRVEKYLIQKLEDIDKKGFYECVQEQRTYDIEKILEELVI